MRLLAVRAHLLPNGRRFFSNKRIDRVLVANRGEIAIRVMKTAEKLGIETVAVFSDADKNSLHTKYAHKAFRIGEASPLQSYLRGDKILDVALKSGAQAIHPGYGFLSENADFAEKCEQAGIVFMGPPAQAIRDMGIKSTAKKIMIAAKVPVIEGYNGSDQEPEHLLDEAKKIGFPVMLKAVCGGGGKGMRIAKSEAEFFSSLQSAQSEAMKAFGNDDMIVEKFVERPRHVEVQIFGDTLGSYVYLWERDCSLQRRHQKVIEEAPAPGLDTATRKRLGENAVEAARAVKYVGAGTVEFIMDTQGHFYFMEMNTRLQVEHPVTEAITGIDLVDWQFKVAQGEPLPVKQEDIPLLGHAMEARIYAEDSNAGFMPTAGRLEHLEFPKNARVDSGVEEGNEVTVHYDPMIAKVIVSASDRMEAIRRLDDALKQTHIGGLCNNVKFIRSCLNHEKFIGGDVYTDFIAEHEKELLAETTEAASKEALAEAVAARTLLDCFYDEAVKSPFHLSDYFRLNHSARKTQKFNGTEVKISFPEKNLIVLESNGTTLKALVSDVRRSLTASGSRAVRFTIEVDGMQWSTKAVQLKEAMMVYGHAEKEWSFPSETVFDEDVAASGGPEARSPMPGVIDKVFVAVGDKVSAGQALAVMIAMKMEYVIKAPFDCVVKDILCQPGGYVAKNAILVKFDKEE